MLSEYMFAKFSVLGSHENYGEIAEHSVPRNCTDFLQIHYDIDIYIYIYIYTGCFTTLGHNCRR